jgi:hypothetical protein
MNLVDGGWLLLVVECGDEYGERVDVVDGDPELLLQHPGALPTHANEALLGAVHALPAEVPVHGRGAGHGQQHPCRRRQAPPPHPRRPVVLLPLHTPHTTESTASLRAPPPLPPSAQCTPCAPQMRRSSYPAAGSTTTHKSKAARRGAARGWRLVVQQGKARRVVVGAQLLKRGEAFASSQQRQPP